MRVRINEGAVYRTDVRYFTGGEEIDLPAEEARKLIKDGTASKVEDKK